MKRYIIIFFLFWHVTAIIAQGQNYSRVRITANNTDVVRLMQLGIAVEDGIIKRGHDITIDLSSYEIKNVKAAGFAYEVLIDDVQDYYRKRYAADAENPLKLKSLSCYVPPYFPTPAGFHLGTMGGFYTYQQMLNKLDSMAMQYPDLLTVKAAADTTKSIEGRTVYYVKLSDNPTIDENEPEVLYTALTHAREGVGMQQLFFYMNYILENYSSNNDIKNLVDNTEMYFIPCVNPDGYIYNETTDPTGGGMWRKNRRNNGFGQYGIDLNRNFGYMWGYDDNGSSPYIWDDTYRGASAFSEPETRIIRNFCYSHQIKITLNQHAFGNDFIYPWGYIGSYYTPDSALFSEYAKLMTKDNYFVYGTCDQTLGYITNGDANDWMYGDQSSKPKIISMTPESGDGNDGFWPVQSRIPEICRDNVTMNLMAARLAGKYAVAEDISPVYISQQQGYFDFSIERLGLDSPATFTVSIQPITANIISAGNQKVFNSMSLLEKRLDSISITLDPFIHNGDKIKFLLSVDNGLYVNTDTIVKVYGPSYIIFSDNCSNINNWYSDTGWDITAEASYSAPSSITDSPYTNYLDLESSQVVTLMPVSLANALSAYLTYECKWYVEAGVDYAQVKISNDGSTWTALCGKYTKPGNSVQAAGEPLYDGFQGSWVKENISLDDYLGQNVFFQFSLVSDDNTNFDGYYFDDMKVMAVFDSANAVPDQQLSDYYISDPMPNPVLDESGIYYTLPVSAKEAYFECTDVLGRVVLNEQLSSGKGAIKIGNKDLANGLYNYFIRCGTQKSGTKKLIVSGK